MNGGLFTIVSFKLNEDYIKENLCEKKDQGFKATLCAGSCYLKKELQNNQENEIPLSNKVKVYYDMVYLLQSENIDTNLFFEFEDKAKFLCLSTDLQSVICKFFRPSC